MMISAPSFSVIGSVSSLAASSSRFSMIPATSPAIPCVGCATMVSLGLHASGKLQIVKADHRQLFRDLKTQLIHPDHRPHGHLIVGNKHSRHIRIVRNKLLNSLHTALNGIIAVIDQRFPYRYIFFFVCIAVPLETFLSCGNFLRSANDPDLTVSCPKKLSLRPQPPSRCLQEHCHRKAP